MVEIDAPTIETDLFVLADGTQFVAPASVRDKYTGAWRRTAAFAPDFANDVLEVLLVRLGADV